MKQISTQERIFEEYDVLISQFANEIKNLNAEGIPSPHIPIANENYDKAKYKIAFAGMETYGWGDMNEFINHPQTYVRQTSKWFTSKGVLSQNGNATFFGFIIRFMEKFYHIDKSKILDRNNPHPILTSYVWANTNSIERYEVTAKNNGVSYDVWEKVKTSSRKLDSINHLISATNAKVIFIMYKHVNSDYVFKEEDFNETMGTISDNSKIAFSCIPDASIPYKYSYLRDQKTHVFIMPHPTWIGAYSGIGFDKYIDSIMKTLSDYKILELPTKESDWEKPEVVINKSSIMYKRQFIASLAETLVLNNVSISGSELRNIFRANDIKTKYGTDYSDNGGRGIHRLIANVWKYYYHKKDYQTAFNIARAYTGQDGEYTY